MHKTPETMEALAAEQAWMRVALHELSQPLTALECRLYLGAMGTGGTPSEEAVEMRASIDEALRQCERMMAKVRAMQEHLSEKH